MKGQSERGEEGAKAVCVIPWKVRRSRVGWRPGAESWPPQLVHRRPHLGALSVWRERGEGGVWHTGPSEGGGKSRRRKNKRE